MRYHKEFVEELLPTENGTESMWCFGSSTVVRDRGRLFATLMRKVDGAQPYNNMRMELLERVGASSWKTVYTDSSLQREPCPIMRLGNGKLLVTTNPTQEPEKLLCDATAVPCVLVFDTENLNEPQRKVLAWDERFSFREHSYRGSAIDLQTGSSFFINLISYLDHIDQGDGIHCYASVDGKGVLKRSVLLPFPARCCYGNTAVKGEEVFVVAVPDIEEPNVAWRECLIKNGFEFTYDFRSVLLLHARNIETGLFDPYVIISSMENTCGKTMNCDMFVDEDKNTHVLYNTLNVVKPVIRNQFFPWMKITSTIEYCVVSNGLVIERRVLDYSTETAEQIPSEYWAGFHKDEKGTLRVVFHKPTDCGEDALEAGLYLAELQEADSTPILLDANPPIHGPFHMARDRMGSSSCSQVDILAEDTRDDKIQLWYIGIEL